jgi:hypothetical protein
MPRGTSQPAGMQICTFSSSLRKHDAKIVVRVPQMAESITEGTLNTWEGNMPRGTSQPAGKLQGRSGGPTQRHCTQWYETLARSIHNQVRSSPLQICTFSSSLRKHDAKIVVRFPLAGHSQKHRFCRSQS